MLRLAAVLVLLATSRGFAAPPGETRPIPPPPPPVAGYAAETLLCDAASAVLIIAASRRSIDQDTAKTYGELGLATFSFGAPMVHLVHGRGARALGSLAMRLSVVGLTVMSAEASDGGANPGMGALVLGGLIVALLDGGMLAQGDSPPPTTGKRAPRLLQPTVATSQQGFALGVAGRF